MPAFTPEQVQLAFLAGQPAINREIKNLTVVHPSWLEGQYEVAPWPVDGASMTEITYRGSLPKMETDFSKWKKVNEVVGCNPCEPNNCGYNWTQFGGSGLERKVADLYDRDWETNRDR